MRFKRFLRRLFMSFKDAFEGFFYVLQRERNLQIEVFVAVVVVAMMLAFRLEIWEMMVLILVIFSVLILEVLNTFIEKVLDLARPRFSRHVKVLKDVMASVVLLSAIMAIVVGLLIFLPRIV